MRFCFPTEREKRLEQNRAVIFGTMMRVAPNHIFGAVPSPLLNYRNRHILFDEETAWMVTESVHPRHGHFQFAEQGMQRPTQDIVQPHRASSSTLENVAEGPIPDVVFHHRCDLPPKAKWPRLRLDSEAYRLLCREVLGRDGWRCQSCGLVEGLQVHHIQLRSRLGDDPAGILVSLCARCHQEVHRQRHTLSGT